MPAWSELEPNWPDEGQGERLRLLCARCIADVCFRSAAYVRVDYRGSMRILSQEMGVGQRMLDVARRARDDGHAVHIDHLSGVGIYADTMVRGTAVCAAHFPDEAQSQSAYPF